MSKYITDNQNRTFYYENGRKVYLDGKPDVGASVSTAQSISKKPDNSIALFFVVSGGILLVLLIIVAVLDFGSNSPAVAPKPPSAPVVARNPQTQQSAPSQPASQPNAPVYNNGWNGSVRQVKEWLKDNLKDPDSFEAINWSPVQTNFDGGYYVRCKYRAKNSFGGYDIANQIFYMDSKGNVLRYVDVNPNE